MVYFLIGFLAAAIFMAVITILSAFKVAGDVDRMSFDEQSC